MPRYKTKDGYTINEKGNKVMSITPSIFVGTATSENGEKIQVLTTWGQSPMVEFEDGSQVIWSWNELINEAIKLKQQKEPTPAATDVSLKQ
ncbi:MULTISPECIES: hypothetical protein [Enterococcus]|uniref:hypothetical protein n=1 Tax=Enterococcus TaxID=1350 RepID=UPI000A34FD35|nr:hypothetical protein [Enterococcus sp. 3C8_DIV0646]OTO31544.1 hypothetical protein A5876_002160 [Enterococcus sp. 3C8_DIV0646]